MPDRTTGKPSGTSPQLKQFVQRVLLIAAPTTDIGGAVIPALAGTLNAGGDAVQKLHLSAIGFARDYNDPAVPSSRLVSSSKAVEAALMTVETLGIVPGREVSKLIDELQGLVERR